MSTQGLPATASAQVPLSKEHSEVGPDLCLQINTGIEEGRTKTQFIPNNIYPISLYPAVCVREFTLFEPNDKNIKNSWDPDS